MTTHEITIRRQIQCIERELGIRKAVYPKQVACGKMAKEQADGEIAAIKAVLHTLQMVERKFWDKPWNQI